MIGWGFLAVAGARGAREQLLRGRDLVRRLGTEGLEPCLEANGLSSFASPDAPRLLLPRGGGAILGRLYRRSASSRESVAELGDEEARAVGVGGAERLVTQYWGAYVGMLCGDEADTCTVVRDPSAAVPVYFAKVDGTHVYVSDPDLLLKLDLVRPVVDDAFLSQWLLYRHLRTARTGLAGIEELLPGTASAVSAGGARTTSCWTPWTFAQRGTQFRDFDEAAAALRATSLRTIPAYAEGAGKPLLELSGGLDSSIIASALSNAGVRFAAVNFVTRSADGDERRYARMVSAATGATLIEVPQASEHGDLLRTPPPLIRPGLSPVLEPIHEAFATTAREIGADLFMSGAGGDSVFCYLTTAAPALDAARELGPSATLRTLGDVSRLCGCTFWTAARHAWRKAWRRSSGRWGKELSFLTPEAAAAAPDRHPWLDAPPDALPGKKQHVEAIVTVLYFLDRGFRGREAAIAYPLMAQPLLELCLRIPTWMWIRDGRNRAAARRAFEGLVPAPILARGGKGRLESMCADAYAKSRTALRGLLLDGHLAADRLIDPVAVEDFLQQPVDRSDVRYFRIFDLATLELWRRSWEGRS